MNAVPRKERLLALDVFRGLTLVCMVLVNTPGNGSHTYTAVKHAPWHGWAMADLVFPFFLFIVGVAIPYSIDSRMSRGDSHGRIVLDAFRRAIVLFAIGLAMNWYAKIDFADWKTAVNFAELRFFNVLQRIGICYFLGTLVYLWFRPWARFALGAAILLFYFVMMKYVPVPGYGAGVLDRVGSWTWYIDYHVMGAHCGFRYNGIPYELKGILSTLPAMVTVLLGIWTGRRLRQPAAASEKLVALYFFGTLGMLLGACWGAFLPFNQDLGKSPLMLLLGGLAFPINQNLWTSSLVLFMGGMAMVVLASCYYIADLKKIAWWTRFFVVFGVNSIAVWVGSVVLSQTFDKIEFVGGSGELVSLKAWMFNGLATRLDPYDASLAFAVLYVLFWWAVMEFLYRRKIFLKV